MKGGIYCKILIESKTTSDKATILSIKDNVCFVSVCCYTFLDLVVLGASWLDEQALELLLLKKKSHRGSNDVQSHRETSACVNLQHGTMFVSCSSS